MITWLSASIHQKNLRIDALQTALGTIAQAVQSVDGCVSLAVGKDATTSPADKSGSFPEDIHSEDCGANTTLQESVLLHGLDETSSAADTHFSIADSDEDF